MKGDDRGRAFRKVSRSAQATAGKQELYRRVVGSGSYPVQVVWAAQDPAMPISTYGEKARAAAGPGGHRPHTRQALPARGPGAGHRHPGGIHRARGKGELISAWLRMSRVSANHPMPTSPSAGIVAVEREAAVRSIRWSWLSRRAGRAGGRRCWSSTSWTWRVTQSRERRVRAMGQCPLIRASVRSLSCSTSIVTVVTPRAWAPAISARTSAEPTPWPCQASATTTPTSAVLAPAGPGLVHRHAVPDDDAAAGGEQGIGGAVAAAQKAEQGRPGRDRGEEP